MVRILRWWSIALSSIGFAFLPLILRRYTYSSFAAFAISMIALCGGTVWIRSVMATGDAVGWATAVVGIWAGIRSRESLAHWGRWAFAAALLAGLATGSKITCIYMWPAIFLSPVRSVRTLVKNVGLWLFAPALGFYLLTPYVMTDPLRMMKAVIGNLVTRPASLHWTTALVAGTSVGIVALGIIGLPLVFRKRRFLWMGLALIWTIAMYFATVLRTSKIDAHYLSPLSLVATLPAAFVVGWLLVLTARRLGRGGSGAIHVALAIGLALSVVFGFIANHEASVAAAKSYGRGLQAVRALERADFEGRLGVQSGWHSSFMAKFESDASIAARLDVLEHQIINGETVFGVLTTSGLSETVARGLADQFNDADRLEIANERPMAHTGKTDGWFVVPIRMKNEAAARRTGVTLTLDDAAEMFKRGELDGILSTEHIPGLVATEDFGGDAENGSVLYLHQPPSQLAGTLPATTATTMPATMPGQPALPVN